MDTVYSTKKYFQNLGSDYYRSPSVSRQMGGGGGCGGTDYTSYRDTVGRRSTLGPSYTHMSKYSYATDHSIGSHYGGGSGYNGGWGLWRDTGNLSPTMMSVSKKRSIKSFSIILMTAAFIVVLAVLSVAGLAFYFSTFRNDSDNSVLAFDGQFHVLRGDAFTTGLKYNHTSTFRQKRGYYEKLIETALQEKGGLSVTKCEIDNFGSGPLIQVKFRVLLDMKTMPMSMTNVEEHIKQSLMQEVTSPASPFKSIKIDPETMDVKRLLDHEILKTASFMREIDHQQQEETSKPSQLMTSTKSGAAFDEKVSKKSGVIEKTIHKFSATTTSLVGGSKAPATNTPSPVIKGSYEITKTEADISEKKDTPPSQFHTTSTVPGHHHKASTAKVKNGGKVGSGEGPIRPNLAKIDKIEKVDATSTQKTSTATEAAPVSTTTPIPSTITYTTPSSTTLEQKNANKDNKAKEDDASKSKDDDNVHKYAENENLPQLDVNLFTSAPVLDSQPWHPISPNSPPDQRKPEKRKGHPATASTSMVVEQRPHQIPQSGVAGPPQQQQQQSQGSMREEEKPGRNKLTETVTKAPSRPIYYQSFTNPTFSLTTMGIERLGAADVRPYPLPVNKLYDEASPIDSGMHVNEGEIMNGAQVHLDEVVAGYQDRFEHLGGGVSAKKPDLTAAVLEEGEGKKEKTTVEKVAAPTTTFQTPVEDKKVDEDIEKEATNAQLGDILFDLLDMNQEQRHKYVPDIEAVTAEAEAEEEMFEETTKLNFINIREHILNRNKEAPAIVAETTTLAVGAVSDEHTLISSSSSVSSSETKSNIPQEEDKKPISGDAEKKPSTWDGPALFPMHTTWELVNGTSDGSGVSGQKPDQSHLRRVYNDTLQAWIVENSEEDATGSAAASSAAIEQHHDKQQQQIVNNANKEMDTGSSKKQEGTLQNISVIFDTLASKLGITPDVSSKSPPFQNKLRNRVTTTTPQSPRTTTAGTKVVTTTPKVTQSTTMVSEPEIITVGRTAAPSRAVEKKAATKVQEEEEHLEDEYDEYEEDDEEEAEEEEARTTTTTTTTTKKPNRRKTTTKRKPSPVTTSKPKTQTPSMPRTETVAGAQVAAAGETRSTVRVAGTTGTKLPPVTTTTTTTTLRPRTTTTVQSIVSRPVEKQRPAAVAVQTTTTTTERPPPTTRASVTESESVIPPIFQLDPTGDDEVVPIIISEPIAGAAEETFEMSSEAISFGKAEVEVVDPTVYEDLLRKQTTAMPPPLVTLLPVRSNSGIRTFRTPMLRRSGGGADIETRRAFSKLPAVPPPATIVRTSMRVGV